MCFLLLLLFSDFEICVFYFCYFFQILKIVFFYFPYFFVFVGSLLFIFWPNPSKIMQARVCWELCKMSLIHSKNSIPEETLWASGIMSALLCWLICWIMYILIQNRSLRSAAKQKLGKHSQQMSLSTVLTLREFLRLKCLERPILKKYQWRNI